MEILILFFLAVLNGILAMSELAIISSRNARLQTLADNGNLGAGVALKLSDNPNRFLSTVQIGITLIGIIAGAFSGARLSAPIANVIDDIAFLSPYSGTLSFIVVVIITTYIALIFGELVPKRIAMQNPEAVSVIVARPMRHLSQLTYPFVWLLSHSTDFILRLIGIGGKTASAVTEEEVQFLLREGIQHGVFDKSEEEMVAGVFRLDDLWVEALMTPRTEIIWLDLNDSAEQIYKIIIDNPSSRFPVADGTIDEIKGIIDEGDVLRHVLSGKAFELNALIKEPLIVPKTTLATSMLELFREQETKFAVVIGEFGGVEGIITLQDIIETVIGEVDEPDIVQRADGSWLVDGTIPPLEFRATLDIDELLPEEAENIYHTLAGFLIAYSDSFPQLSDIVEWSDYRFEVVDMDGRRIDKILVTKHHHSS